MSELKSYDLVDIQDYRGEVYLKSEADNVIAELKNACNDKDDWCLHTLKREHHHKYKRCLTMARWCSSRSYSWCFDPADEELHKSDFYDKWKRRWLELAEKIQGDEMIIGIDKAKGKDFTVQFNCFGLGSELVVNDEIDDVSDWAKDEAKELTKQKLKRR